METEIVFHRVVGGPYRSRSGHVSNQHGSWGCSGQVYALEVIKGAVVKRYDSKQTIEVLKRHCWYAPKADGSRRCFGVTLKDLADAAIEAARAKNIKIRLHVDVDDDLYGYIPEDLRA